MKCKNTGSQNLALKKKHNIEKEIQQISSGSPGLFKWRDSCWQNVLNQANSLTHYMFMENSEIEAKYEATGTANNTSKIYHMHLHHLWRPL